MKTSSKMADSDSSNTSSSNDYTHNTSPRIDNTHDANSRIVMCGSYTKYIPNPDNANDLKHTISSTNMKIAAYNAKALADLKEKTPSEFQGTSRKLTNAEHHARKMAYLDGISKQNRMKEYKEFSKNYDIIAKTDKSLANPQKLTEGHRSNNAESPEERRAKLINNHQQAGPSTPTPVHIHDPNKWRYDILERGGINRGTNEQPLVAVSERIVVHQPDPKPETREERRQKMMAGRNM